MREIKFRAWDGEEMVHYLTITSDGECIYSDLIRRNVPVFQYTGLHDKNGREIYEGDVVLDVKGTNKYRNDYEIKPIGTAEGSEGRPCLLAGFPLQQRCTIYDLSGNTDRLEIIGNIYENPELLKESNNN